MTSVVRSIAQRNTNSNQIIPVYEGTTTTTFGPFDLSGVAYYTLNLPTVQYTGGSFFVDFDGVDSSGNPINVNGQYRSGGNYVNNTNFIVNVPIAASYVTNMEFTIFFKNVPYGPGQLLSVGILSTDGLSIPYTMSPPAPQVVAPVTPSITFKSDGTKYTAVGSGPAGWLGPYLLALLVNSLAP
jgi:hypothetical protein